MNPQVNAITLGVTDLNRAKQFYGEGLGCPIIKDHGEFVSLSLGDGSSALALYPRDALADDAGVAPAGTGSAASRSPGSSTPSARRRNPGPGRTRWRKIAKPAQRAQWSGYFGYFTDPEGNLWKVASGA